MANLAANKSDGICRVRESHARSCDKVTTDIESSQTPSESRDNADLVSAEVLLNSVRK